MESKAQHIVAQYKKHEILKGLFRRRERLQKKRAVGETYEKMVKFGRPEATWKTREEENSCGRECGERMVTEAEGCAREGERATREVLRERAIRFDGIREREREREETKRRGIGNERTSMTKKEKIKREVYSGRFRIRMPTEKI